MRHLKTENLLAVLLLVILGGLVLHAPFTVWLVSNGAPDWVKAWKEIILFVVSITLVATNWRKILDIVKEDRLFQIITAFGVLHLVTAAFSMTSKLSIAAGLLIDLRYIWYFAIVFVFLKIYPQFYQHFLRVGVICAAVVVGFLLLQLALPHDSLKYIGYSQETIKPFLLLDENPDFVRMNSTLRGPNPLGAFAMIVLLGVVAYGMAVGRTLTDKMKKWLHVFFAISGLIALWVSYSRSAVLGFLFGLVALQIFYFRNKLNLRHLGVALGVMLVLVGFGFAIRDTTFFHNVVLHDNPTTGAEITSDAGHVTSLLDGVARMAAQPFGAGIGSTGSASLDGEQPLIIENQYLMIAHEVGWLGLILFVAIWAIVLVRLWRKKSSWLAGTIFASGIGLAAIAMTWPVLTDDPVSMIWWGMAAVALSQEKQMSKRRRNGKSADKKTARTA